MGNHFHAKEPKGIWEVVLFNPTYLTNNLRLPFAFFLAAGGDGATLVAAACMLANETVQTLDWVFSTFRSICQHRIPKVFYTDRCAAIHRALQHNFPEAHHLICRWHLDRNITRNLASTLKASLPSFLRDFYVLSDRHLAKDTFQDRWEEVVARPGLRAASTLQTF